jgi:hypothetical protein
MNWSEVREQFPVTKKYIFLDLANKCALPLFATKTVMDYIKKQQDFGGDKEEWFKTIDDARVNFGRLINASCFLQVDFPHYCRTFSPGTGGEFLC